MIKVVPLPEMPKGVMILLEDDEAVWAGEIHLIPDGIVYDTVVLNPADVADLREWLKGSREIH